MTVGQAIISLILLIGIVATAIFWALLRRNPVDDFPNDLTDSCETPSPIFEGD